MSQLGILSGDTAAEVERRQIERWRRMTPAEKWALVRQLNTAVLDLARAGIRQRHPGASDRGCELRLRRLTLGPELALKVYPEIAALRD